VLEKKISEILENSAFVWQGCGHGAAGGVTLQKLLRQTSLPASHQYGLQIAEGMVTFFESYERKLEKYWTKTLFCQLS